MDADADCRDCFPRRHHPGGLFQVFDTDVSMISASSVEVMFARADPIAFQHNRKWSVNIHNFWGA